MPSAKDLTADGRFKALFVGLSGSGKKSAACSWPGWKRYFDFDDRIRGVMGSPWVDREELDYEYYPPKSAKGNVFDRINKDAEILYNDWRAGKCKYKTFIVGSVTGEARAFLLDAIPLTHSKSDSGKRMGTLEMPGFAEYGYQSVATEQLMSYFNSMPMNLIVTGHIVPIYRKEDPDNPMSPNVECGHKLCLTDKMSASFPGQFDNIFMFDKKLFNGKIYHTVEFRGQFARTSFTQLRDGIHVITETNFYNYMMGLINGTIKPEIKKF